MTAASPMIAAMEAAVRFLIGLPLGRRAIQTRVPMNGPAPETAGYRERAGWIRGEGDRERRRGPPGREPGGPTSGSATHGRLRVARGNARLGSDRSGRWP